MAGKYCPPGEKKKGGKPAEPPKGMKPKKGKGK